MTRGAIRVAHVITGLDRGGAETALVRLLGGLGRDEFASTVISLTGRGVLGDQVAATGAALEWLGWRRGRLPGPGRLWHLARRLRAVRPDVVQTWLYHADLAGLLAARLAGRAPVLWNIRCSDMDFSKYGRGTRLTVAAAARLSSWPAGIVVNSAAGRQVHDSLGYRPKAWHLIPNGIDTDRLRPDRAAGEAWRAAEGIAAGIPLIGHVARLDPQKDHDGFLQALSLLAARGRPFLALLAGRGTEGLADRLAALDLGDKVRLLGERDDIPRLMQALDLFCMSSAYGEGFRNVLAEAMACGVPAVATDVGDAGAILAAPERLVPSRNPRALADALDAALAWDAATWRAAGAEARRHVEADYALSRNVARYAELYRAMGRAGMPSALSLVNGRTDKHRDPDDRG